MNLRHAGQVTATGSSTKGSGSSKPQAARASQHRKPQSKETQPTDEPTPKRKLESDFAFCSHDESTREGAEEEAHTDDEVIEPCTPHHPAMYTEIEADENPVEPSQSQQLPSPQRVSVCDSDEEMNKSKKTEVKGTFKDHTITDDRNIDFDSKVWILI